MWGNNIDADSEAIIIPIIPCNVIMAGISGIYGEPFFMPDRL